MFEKITVNQCLHFSTVFGAVIKCKDYSQITLESGTHVKSIEKYIEYICSVYCETKNTAEIQWETGHVKKL